MVSAVSQDLLEKLPHLKDALKRAGHHLLDQFREAQRIVEYKDAHNIRTQADIAAENSILADLEKLFPDDSDYGEESGLHLRDPRRIWFVDALDGTTNFVLRVPLFATQCAYLVDGAIQAAIIYVPTTDECFTAVLGQGADCNGIRLQVADPPNADPQKAVVVLSRAAQEEEIARHVEIYPRIAKTVRTVRVWNSAAGDFVRVAQGGVHASVHNGANLYDVLPGILLVREAGGLVTDFLGNDVRLPRTEDKKSVDRLLEMRADTICSAPLLHKVLLPVLKPFSHWTASVLAGETTAVRVEE